MQPDILPIARDQMSCDCNSNDDPDQLVDLRDAPGDAPRPTDLPGLLHQSLPPTGSPRGSRASV
jgi:hypothetical protein